MKTQRLMIDAVLAEDLKSMAYAQNSTVDRVLYQIIRMAASDATWSGGQVEDLHLQNRRKGTRAKPM